MISLHSQPLAFIKPARNLKAIRYWFSVSTLEKLRVLTQRRWTHPQGPYPKFKPLKLNKLEIDLGANSVKNCYNHKSIQWKTYLVSEKHQFSKNINKKQHRVFGDARIFVPSFYPLLKGSIIPSPLIRHLCLQTHQRHPESSVVTPWERCSDRWDDDHLNMERFWKNERCITISTVFEIVLSS